MNNLTMQIDLLVKKWLLEAGEILKEGLNNNDNLNIETKKDKDDIVTLYDKKIENFFIEKITTNFPDHLFLGEETESFEKIKNRTDKYLWILDPIDGTSNFAFKKRDFAITLGVFYEDIGLCGYVYDVMRNELYSAIKGQGAFCNDVKLPPLNENLSLSEGLFIIGAGYCDLNKFLKLNSLITESHGMRTYGCCALDLMDIATGRAVGMFNRWLNPWDIAGGKIIIEELNGVLTRIDGSSINLLEKGSVISSTPKIINKMVSVLFVES